MIRVHFGSRIGLAHRILLGAGLLMLIAGAGAGLRSVAWTGTPVAEDENSHAPGRVTADDGRAAAVVVTPAYRPAPVAAAADGEVVDAGVRQGVDADRAATASAAAAPSRQASPEAGPHVPLQIDPCLWAVELYRRLPPSVRFTSLTSESSGDYILEGISPAGEVAALVSFVDTLQQIPSRVSLSYWREGGVPDDRPYRFIYRGVVDAARGAPLSAVTSPVADSLFADVTRRAWRSGFDSVTLMDSEALRLTAATSRRRSRLSATGTHRQISAFTRFLREVADEVVVSELVIAPVSGSGGRWRRAQIDAALEVVVEQSSPAGDSEGGGR